ncbi:hypothetical protein CSPX01_16788 [Colletotrichum filicis]|nr:hypothetical protein CSPX01_16788 [Colletotrichum filicis]
MNQGSSSAMLREEEEYLGRRTAARQGKTQDMRADKKPFALVSELDFVKHPVGIGVLIMERRRDLATVEGWGEQGEELRVVKLGARGELVTDFASYFPVASPERRGAKQSSPLPALFPPHPPPSLLPLAVALALALALAIALALALALALAPPPRYLLLLLLVHHRLSIASLSHPLLLNSSTSSSPSSFLRHASPPPDCLDSNLAWFCTHAPCLVLILLPSFSPSSFIPLFPQTLGSTKPIQSTRHTRSPIESKYLIIEES